MKLKFCTVCDNLLYINVATSPDETNQVPEMQYVCKNCGNIQRGTDDEEDRASRAGQSICVLETRLGEDDSEDYKRYMTPYLKYDPTLPRVSHIICPNTKCQSPDGSKEVIVVKYDKPNMKYVYCCESCDTLWKTGESVTQTIKT